MELIVKNEGNVDRIIRVIVGIAAIGAFFFVASPFNWVALAVGVIALAPGALGTCPLYRVFGIKTCKV